MKSLSNTFSFDLVSKIKLDRDFILDCAKTRERPGGGDLERISGGGRVRLCGACGRKLIS